MSKWYFSIFTGFITSPEEATYVAPGSMPVASSNEAATVVAAAAAAVAAVAAVAATVRCGARLGGAKTLKLLHLKCFFFYRLTLANVHLSDA